MRYTLLVLLLVGLVGCSTNVTEIKVISFDVFGALMNLDKSLIRNIHNIVGDYITDSQVEALADEWAEHYGNTFWQYNSIIKNPAVKPADPNLFRLMLETGLHHILKKMNISEKIPRELQAKLHQCWGDLIPWENTGETLKFIHSLKNKDGSRRFKLSILSNGDRETLVNASKIFKTQFGFEFDYILGFSDAGIFKPEPNFYKVVEDQGYKKEEVLHVAGSQFDAIGSKSYGYKSAWNFGDRSEYVNLLGQKQFDIDFYLKDLSDLKKLLV
ncbi:haloacid dehalogenase [Acrasis kona]|uniref:Haloacid dehalogenase n=1 Tax=Acrasis kona TaxID=1008807 RepID=A0AAW2YL16_9EUKA